MLQDTEPVQDKSREVLAALRAQSDSPVLSPNANAEIIQATNRYEVMLRSEAALIARQKKADVVSAIDVQVAEQTIQFARHRGFSHHLGTIGGIAVAPALSIVVLLSQGTQLSTGSIALGIASAIFGSVAIAIHAARH